MPQPRDYQDVYARALARAAAHSGGNAQLAKRLGVPLRDIEDWLHGQGKPDIPVLLRIVAIALDEESPGTS